MQGRGQQVKLHLGILHLWSCDFLHNYCQTKQTGHLRYCFR